MVDFLTVLGGSKQYNFHSHTPYCDGHGGMREFIEAAVAAGFTHYGFSPHSPVHIDSPCNMSFGDVPEYLAEVNRLRDEYAGRIRVFASMEIDYFDAEHGPASRYFRDLPLDYRIGSVHFVPARHTPGVYHDIDGGPDRFRHIVDNFFDGDIRYLTELYFSQSMDMVRAGGIDMIGHLDKVGYSAREYLPGIEGLSWYRDAAYALVDAIIDSGITVEINTKAYERSGRLFPSAELLGPILRAGIPVVVNSDAHYPDRITSGRSAGLALLGEGCRGL